MDATGDVALSGASSEPGCEGDASVAIIWLRDDNSSDENKKIDISNHNFNEKKNSGIVS